MQLIVLTYPKPIPNEVEIINQLFMAGLEVLHLRKPEMTAKEFCEYIEGIDSCNYDQVVIHDHLELAVKYQLKGVHFTHRTKNLVDSANGDFIRSISCHNVAELNEYKSKVDYALLAPVFDSISKPGHNSIFQLDQLKEDLKELKYPVIALGGVDENTIVKAKHAGFYGAAVLGALWECNTNIVEQFTKLKSLAV